jgi:uncharacterized membrane protein
MAITQLKARKLAQAYIDTGFNKTKAMRKVEPESVKLDKDYQYVKANRLIGSDKVKKSLAELMEESGLTDSKIKKILDRNASQTKNIPASNQAVDIALKVKGSYAPEKKAVLNVSLEGSIDEGIDSILEELEALKQLSSGDKA